MQLRFRVGINVKNDTDFSSALLGANFQEVMVSAIADSESWSEIWPAAGPAINFTGPDYACTTQATRSGTALHNTSPIFSLLWPQERERASCA